jgi:hypothetical protein
LKRTPLRSKRPTPRRQAPERVPQGRMKRRQGSDPTAGEARHHERLRALGCIVTGQPTRVLHHIMHMPGKSQRRDHRYVVPLLARLHNMGDDSVHALAGEERFREVHGVDLVAEAVRLWRESVAMGIADDE